jgi:Fur family zinc uptake transcriptional regulator
MKLPMTATPTLTRNQSMVLAALAAAAGPLSAYALLDRLRGDGFRAPPQVYRALEKLVEIGLVHRLESVNAFVACNHPDGHDGERAAFAICDRCGGATEFEDEVVRDRLLAWAERNGFSAPRATIEIRGVCATCMAA